MASFRTHISFGIAAGVLGIIGLVSLATANNPGLMVAIFVAAALGSILPDLDSDSGIPFYITFGSLTIVCGVLAFMWVYKTAPSDWAALVLWTLGTLAFVWWGVGYFFKRVTKHRGMAHSLPAALLAGLIVFTLASRLHYADDDAFLLGTAMAVGYCIHLILDEVWAAVNFQGTLFVPNKALGSALKVTSANRYAMLGVFAVIAFLAAGNVGRLWSLAENFWHSIF